MRGEETMAACAGLASGTLMTSMRKSAVVGSSPGARPEQPASSSLGRTGAEPDTYTYTFASSSGSLRSECVCEPRQVCTLEMYLGARMSLMSKMRMPRRRLLLTVSGTPAVPQSRRPPRPSPETNIRLP